MIRAETESGRGRRRGAGPPHARPDARRRSLPTSRSKCCSSRSSSHGPAASPGPRRSPVRRLRAMPRPCSQERTPAALGERLSRLVQRKALRSAAAWEGPLKAPRTLDQPASGRHLPARLRAMAARRDRAPPGSIRRESRSRSPKAPLVDDAASVAHGSTRLREAGHRNCGRRFRHRLCQPRLSDRLAARHAQDRPRPDRGHRRRDRATGSSSRR